MFREKIPHAQMRMWMVAALAAPVAAYSAGCGWSGILLMTAVGIAAYLLVRKLWEPPEKLPVWFAAIQWLWLGIYAGRIAGYAATFWPEGMNGKSVPLILIALACASVEKGKKRGAVSASVLFWLIVPAIVGVLFAGKNNVKWEWLPDAASGWKAELISLMLVPAMSVSLLQRDERKQGVSPLLAVGILGLGAAAVVSGSLNQSRAAGLVNPLYEYSKSVTLLGSVKGLEAVVSCALTAGWFVVLSLLISAAGNAVYGEIEKRYRKAVWGSGLVAALTVLWGIGDPNMEAVIAGVIWVVLPLIMGVQKKLKKQKNSA